MTIQRIYPRRHDFPRARAEFADTMRALVPRYDVKPEELPADLKGYLDLIRMALEDEDFIGVGMWACLAHEHQNETKGDG